jgi:predicted nucleotidyltransferase
MIWSRSFDPKGAALAAVEAARKAAGENLLGATLYGSAARGEFEPAHSDVNVAFVFASLAPAELERLKAVHETWTRLRVARPLLVSRETLGRSLDAFPLEYLLIRECHVPLSGENHFRDLRIETGPLRQEVERTLRAQEMGLAWTYIALANTPSGARHWAARSGTAIGASASGLLHLAGEPVPRTRAALAERCRDRFGVDEEGERLLTERRPGSAGHLEATRLLASAQRLLTKLTEAADALTRPSPSTHGGNF